MDDVGDVPLAAAGLSQPTTLIAEEHKKLKKIQAVDKRNIARLSIEQRARLLEMRDKKEVRQFLMPSAPLNKKRRKLSPVRVLCPLLSSTPEIPPPRLLQDWEINRSALDVSGPSRVEFLGGDAATPTSPKNNQLVFTPSTGVTTLDKGQTLDEILLFLKKDIGYFYRDK